MSGALNPLVKATLKILSDGEFHSGNDLADTLAVSRTAVWKHIQTLQSLGLEIDAISGKGYRLIAPLRLLELEKIKANLSKQSLAQIERLDVLDQVESTNTYLSNLQHSSGKAQICLAEMQTSGRGRSGKTWVSPFAANIYLSIRWCFSESPNQLIGLSLAIGITVRRVLLAMGFQNIGLKWPNDILWNGRKLGGILIDLKADPFGPSDTVIGIGINCRVGAGEMTSVNQPWVDLQQITPQPEAIFDRNELAAGLITHILEVIKNYTQTKLHPYLEEWRQSDVYHGKSIRLQQGENIIRGRVKGISEEGFLMLETAQGIKSFASGEVNFLRPDLSL